MRVLKWTFESIVIHLKRIINSWPHNVLLIPGNEVTIFYKLAFLGLDSVHFIFIAFILLSSTVSRYFYF